jgi:class I fructose-bisphosphate aldolase
LLYRNADIPKFYRDSHSSSGGNTMAEVTTTRTADLLGDEAASLLDHTCETITKDQLHLPGGDFVDRVWQGSDRNPRVLRNMQSMFDHGRLGGTGYLSILPVDQGIEHSGGASFAPNPMYFDPENIIQLAIEGGCNAVATTYGVLGSMARQYAHKIPFILKFNHNELLSYRPNDVGERRGCLRHGMRGRGRDDLLRLGRVPASDSRNLAGVCPGA